MHSTRFLIAITQLCRRLLGGFVALMFGGVGDVLICRRNDHRARCLRVALGNKTLLRSTVFFIYFMPTKNLLSHFWIGFSSQHCHSSRECKWSALFNVFPVPFRKSRNL